MPVQEPEMNPVPVADDGRDDCAAAESTCPSLTVRLLGLTPILYGAYLLGVISWRVTPQFEQSFKEMDMGPLPWRTQAFLTFLNSSGVYITAVALVAGTIFYWKKASRSAASLVMFNTVAFIACHQAYWFAMNALFDPLIEIMQKIGK